MKILLLFGGLFWLSCKNTSKDEFKKSIPQIRSEKKLQNIFQCTTVRDTIFSNGDYIKYISIDTMFGVQIKIGNIVDTLDFLFNCNTTNGLIPSFFKKDTSKIYLQQGFGFTYRNMIVCLRDGNKIVKNQYEIAEVYAKSPTVFVYKENNTDRKVQVFFLFENRVNSYLLPKKFQKCEIKLTEVYPDYLLIKFTNGKVLHIYL